MAVTFSQNTKNHCVVKRDLQAHQNTESPEYLKNNSSHAYKYNWSWLNF